MMNSTERSGGTGFLNLLTLLFIALKLTSQIDWSWWWVLAPTWAPAAFFVVVLSIGGLATMTLHAMETPEQRKRRELAEQFKGLSRVIDRQDTLLNNRNRRV